MTKSIAPTTDSHFTPIDVTRFRPQSRWKSLLDAAAPLTPAQWLDREIQRMANATTVRWAVASASITEALRIAGDRSNDHATAAAAEYLSVARLPDRPRRNAGLPATRATAEVSGDA